MLDRKDLPILDEYVKANPEMSMVEIAEKTGATYGQVRSAFPRVGLNKTEIDKQTRRKELEKHVEAITELRAEGLSMLQIRDKLGLSHGIVQDTIKEFNIPKPERVERHGEAVEYNRGCRCVTCIAGNTRRCYEHRQQYLGTNTVPEGVKHGTENSYRNYGCRCDKCREAGRKSLKKRTQTPKSKRKRSVKLERWTKEETLAIIDYSKSAKEHALETGRSIGSINTRRSGFWKVYSPEDVQKFFKEKESQ